MMPCLATRFSLPVLFSALSAALPACALAQQADTTLPAVTVTAAPPGGSAATASVGGFSEASVLQTPVSVSVYAQEQLQERGVRQTTDLVRLDASLNEAYNAIGYAEQFSIRGFALDNAASYRKDGLIISSDASIPLENKERIEVLKGLAGLQAGIATPGGILNYVTKRPTAQPLRSVTLGASERGTLYGAVDLGGRSDDRRFGYRINAAAERLRSYVRGADGERQFVSGAFDWRLTPDSLLQLDLDYQRKSQLTVPGFQLLGGTALPDGISARTMLNNQPWSRPTESHSANVGVRYEHQLNASWTASLAFNRSTLRRDDFAAFPYGCAAEGLFPGFCASGDYDVYDFQSENESKQLLSGRAQLQGSFSTGSIAHALTAGVDLVRRRDRFGDCVYGAVDCFGSLANGTSNIYTPAEVPPSAIRTGDVLLRRHGREASFFVQDVLGLAPAWKLHAGVRHTRIDRLQRYPERAPDNRYDKRFLLPNLALVFSPREDFAVYGAYAHGLEHGGIAPLLTSNQDAILDPARSRQVEIGTKASPMPGWTIAAALFRIEKPLEYTDSSFTWVRNGEARHDGIELSAQGRLNRRLTLGLSVAALRSRQQGTGEPTLDGKRVTNVPDFRSVVSLDYAVPDIAGLGLNASWLYSSSKSFTPDNPVDVPGYHLLYLGASYATRVAGSNATFRVGVDNVFDRFYWREASQALGGYVLPGAPRTFRVTAQFDF
ncbi:MAG TPA: TonB-dependent siderophore receptor [Noviherbaspirillum sp.]|jgi:iron complex outermembrane receptor protein|uniref:TonB-dependent siderophore receptor n=1 Tax=Noviherbaspirillum sp. TaxID=1926288 RepID=UPI002F951720